MMSKAETVWILIFSLCVSVLVCSMSGLFLFFSPSRNNMNYNISKILLCPREKKGENISSFYVTTIKKMLVINAFCRVIFLPLSFLRRLLSRKKKYIQKIFFKGESRENGNWLYGASECEYIFNSPIHSLCLYYALY